MAKTRNSWTALAMSAALCFISLQETLAFPSKVPINSIHHRDHSFPQNSRTSASVTDGQMSHVEVRQESVKPPVVVYRGDGRPPEELRNLGGFPTSLEGPLINQSFGLQAHHNADGANGKFRSAYTSTARDFGTTLMFATDFGKRDGWVYKIHATPNMIDLSTSGFELKYEEESEFSAMGGIRWNQVLEWVPVTAIDHSIASGYIKEAVDLALLQKEKTQGQKSPKSWIKNEEYDKKYDAFAASPGQPQLAGDPDNLKKFSSKSLHQHALEFMRKNGPSVAWDETKFPFLPLTPPIGAWKGPSPLNSPDLAYVEPKSASPTVTTTGQKKFVFKQRAGDEKRLELCGDGSAKDKSKSESEECLGTIAFCNKATMPEIRQDCLDSRGEPELEPGQRIPDSLTGL